MQKLKIYFAHAMSLYGTQEEKALIEKIKAFCREEAGEDFEIINPASLQKEYNDWLKNKRGKNEHAMRFFKAIVQDCDAVFFQGKTPGVAYECRKAQEVGIPTFDLASIG